MKHGRLMQLSLATAISLLSVQTALAQGVGNLGSLPTSFQNTGGGWFVGDATGAPIPVVRDPNGPKWHKHFTDPNGFINPFPGQAFNVHERLVIAPTLAWSDWHEEILTPGWEWSPQVLMLVNVAQQPTNLNIVNTPGTLTQGGSLSFFFDPLPPGTVIDIRKQLVYTGPAGIAVPAIEIAQYPTPEPASLGLLALGSVVALPRRRRQTR